MSDTLLGGGDRRRILSPMRSRGVDRDLLAACNLFITKLREFHSPKAPYARAEAAGLKGALLEAAEEEQAQLYAVIETLQTRMSSLPAASMAGVSAKAEAISLLNEYQGTCAPGATDDLRQSWLRDLQVIDAAKLTGKPSKLDWMGRRHSEIRQAQRPDEHN